jgi:hypothetical protein
MWHNGTHEDGRLGPKHVVLIKVKGKVKLSQAMEAHRVVRR